MRRLLLFICLVLIGACRFNVERDIAPGEIRGKAVFLQTDGQHIPAGGTVVELLGSKLKLKTDAQGNFTIRQLPPGEYAIRTTYQYGPGEKDVAGLKLPRVRMEERDGAAVRLGTLTLLRLAAVEGIVSFNEEPAPGARVLLDDYGQQSADRTAHYLFEGVYPISVLAGEEQARLTAFAGSGDRAALGKGAFTPMLGLRTRLPITVNLALENVPPAEVRGKVALAATYAPMTATAIPNDGSAPIIIPVNQDGTYVFPSVPAGIYTFRFEAEGYQSIDEPLTVVAGEALRLPTILLTKVDATCGFPAGQISDANGNGVGDLCDPRPDEKLPVFCYPEPCLHGGTCTEGPASFLCTCVAGWSGATCEIPQDPTKLGPPSAVYAVARDGSARVAWSRPAADGGKPILGYSVTATPGGKRVTADDPNQLSLPITGLDPGTSYSFAVRALNADGEGPESASSDPVVTASPPGAAGEPSSVVATTGNWQATVTWSAPASDGGNPITGYVVTASPGGLSVTTAADVFSVTLLPLEGGRRYVFTVRALNAVGSGQPSEFSNIVTVEAKPAAPDAPLNVTAAIAGATQIDVSWLAPLRDGGSPITRYTVTASPGGISASTVDGKARTLHIEGLTQGTTYTFTVRATNAIGVSAESTPSSAVKLPPLMVVPEAPTITSVTVGDAQATVSWNAPANSGSDPITKYVVTVIPGGITHEAADGQTTSLVVPGLMNGFSYTFTVHAVSAAGEGPPSTASMPVTPFRVPGAPTIDAPVLAPGTGNIHVSWEAPVSDGGSALTGYLVNAEPGGLVQSAGPGETSLTMGGLVPGTSYTFTVRAENAAGLGATSASSAPLTAAMPPESPVIGSIDAGDGSALVRWTAPANDGYTLITGYTVFAFLGGTPAGSFNAAPADASLLVSGLTNGASYTFRVGARNAVGESAPSALSVEVTPSSVPSTPTGVTATAGAGEATVSWTPPASNGGAAITGYTLTSSPGGIGVNVGGGITSTLVHGLTNGTSYTFTVIATNVRGNSLPSAPSNVVTPLTVPGAPSDVTATAGDKRADLSWTAPAFDGGSAITQYTVTESPGGRTTTVLDGKTAISITGLTNGTTYTFAVVATNSVGDGAASAPSNAVTPATTPDAPTAVTAARGNAQATVSWTAPASNGGAAITEYIVKSSPGGISANVAGNVTSTIVGGLTNGTEYVFTVSAANREGFGPTSMPSNAVTPATVPDAPTEVIAVRGNGGAAVTWSAPAWHGGAAITGYKVVSSPEGIEATAAETSAVVLGLSNGTGYTFTVVAINDVGESAPSLPSNSVTPASVPDAPTAVAAVRGDAQITVSWTAPDWNGGDAITNYVVTSSPEGISATVAGTERQAVINGLTNGTTYTFTVVARNGVGNGASSVPSNAVTPATLPGAPTVVTAVRGNGEATVSWSAPSVNGGSPITGYTVTSSPGGWTTSTTGANSVVFAGLANGTLYTFTVYATNDVGAGPPSVPSNAVTPATVPSAPKSVSAAGGNAMAIVSWVAPDSNGGAAITGYKVTSNPGGLVTQASAGATNVAVSGLTNGTTYRFTVVATNEVGDGVWSLPSNALTPATVPDAPTAVTAVRGDRAATVTWTPPAYDGGLLVTSYTVTSIPYGDTLSVGPMDTSVVFGGLYNGTAYTFTVSATNEAGSATSMPSNAVTPAGVPQAPLGAWAEPSGADVMVHWIPGNANGAPITSYTVTASPGGQTVTADGASSQALFSGLMRGTIYSFTVVATNDVGDSAPSSPSNTVRTATTPAWPQSVFAERGDAQATVTWAAPYSDGGLEITSYTVTASPGGKSVTVGGGTISATVTGLTNGVTYTFTVVATNGLGAGSPSSPSNPVTPARAPDAPTNVTAVRGDAQATVSWTAPSFNGGSAILSYTVTASPGGKTATVSGAQTNGTVTGLTNGVAYTFTVVATNDLGPSPASASSNQVTPARVPDAPTNVTVVRGDAQVSVNWTAPASHGGSPITSYKVTSSPGGKTATVGGGASFAIVTGLTNGASYTFTVVATNDVGDSPPSSPSDLVIPATVPGAPTSVVAVRGDAQATVSWTAPASSGGSAVTSYTVTSSPDGKTATVPSGSTSTNVTGLTNGSSYTFTVVATNGIGNSAASAPSNAIVPASVPGAPLIGSAVAGNAQATVSWTPPASNGGAAISGYTVTSSPGGKTVAVAAGMTSGTVTGLTNGTAYAFTVVATNAVGDSAPSAPSNTVTPATFPGAPTSVSASAGDGLAVVTWAAPPNNGSAITQYTVTSTPGGNTVTVSGSQTNGTVTGLTNGVTYTLKVTATNGVGTGTASGPSNPVTPVGVPGAPTITAATPATGTAGAMLVSWSPVASNGSPITGCTVTASPGGITASTSGSSTIAYVPGLTPGISYSFTVQATNAVGTGPSSLSFGPVTAASPPGAPTNVTASPGDRSATVSWSPPLSDGFRAITGYTVKTMIGATLVGTLSVSAEVTSVVVPSLTNGTNYSFTVVATNAVGDSLGSNPWVSVTPMGLPGAPAIDAVLMTGPATAMVYLNAPSDDGGAGFLTYTVVAEPGGFNYSGIASLGPIAFSGFISGNTYTFAVYATNAAGSGPWSAPFTYVHAPTPVSSCGVTISRNGYYNLTSDLDCGGGAGITVESYGVTLNLNGHSITTTGASITLGATNNIWSVQVDGPGTVSGSADAAVVIAHCSSCGVNGITATGNRVGIATVGSSSDSNSFIANCTLTSNDVGIQLTGGNRYTVAGNNVTGGDIGIQVGGPIANSQYSNGNRLVNNTVTNCNQFGILVHEGSGLDGTTAPLVHYNTVSGCGQSDLYDMHSGCSPTVWENNTYGTRNQVCIQ